MISNSMRMILFITSIETQVGIFELIFVNVLINLKFESVQLNIINYWTIS